MQPDQHHSAEQCEGLVRTYEPYCMLVPSAQDDEVAAEDDV